MTKKIKKTDASLKKKSGGEKFVHRYDVESTTIYKDGGTFKNIKIPGPDHFLYDASAPKTFDPIRVEAIDRDGKMTTAIECWSDPDTGILWVLDGRGRFLDVEEVNRRRTKDDRELVKPYLVPFYGDEKAAVARVFEKNFHTRQPTPSSMALALQKCRNAGYTWEACCKILHVVSDDPEQYGRKLLPLAFCVEEVRKAIDAGDLPRGAAAKFGGSMPDGSKALGKREQLDLLAELLKERERSEGDTTKPVPAKARERLKYALGNGAAAKLPPVDKLVAKSFAALLARMDGDVEALKPWPAIAAVVESALKPLKRGPKPKDTDEDDADDEEMTS